MEEAMTQSDLENLFDDLLKLTRKTSDIQMRLFSSIAGTIGDRLLELYKATSSSEASDVPSFESWLQSEFEYQNFSMSAITEIDSVLKSALSNIRRVNHPKGGQVVALIVNNRFKSLGYTLGLDPSFLETASI